MGARFVAEMTLGFLLPAILLTSPAIRAHTTGRLAAALLLMGGLAFNRLNVAFLGMNMEGTYVPSFIEVLVSLATVAALLFFYIIAVKLLPIYDADEPVSQDPGGEVGREVSRPAVPAAAI
jgi:formate dehydrogenase iron-sulfur subunit